MRNHTQSLTDPRYGFRNFLIRMVGKLKSPKWCWLTGHRWVPNSWLTCNPFDIGYTCVRCKEHHRSTR